MTSHHESPTDLVSVRDPARVAAPGRLRVLVARTRLDHRYASSTGGVLRVLAPGGYGKSTIVSRWTADERRPVRWLNIERLDNDVLVLAAALDQCLAPLSRPSEEAVPRVREFSSTNRSLAGMMRSAPPFVLVLDDLHHLDSSESIDLIGCLAEELPPPSTLVLVGRSFRGWPSARLRLDPGIDDITADDLAFDLGETEQMAQLLGLDSDIDVVTSLHRQFEGWPAGLRLAALGNSGNTPGAAAFTDLDHLPYVTEYVAHEWLGRLDDDDRELLMSAACLGRFNAEMCDAILGRADSDAALRQLARDDAIIVSADRRGGWYRMHPVVGASLAAELQRRDRTRWRNIHTDAAAWWADAGDTDLAIEHASAAGDVDACERLVVRDGASYMARGMNTTVMRWLAHIGDERLLAAPDLCFLAIFVATQTGSADRADHLLRLLPDLMADQPDDVRARGRAVRAIITPCSAAESIESIEPIVGSLPSGPWRATARWALGVNLFLVGDGQALDVLRTAAAEADLTGMLVLRPNIVATIAAIELIEGRGDDATTLARQAVAAIADQRAESIAPTAIVSAAAALTEALAGRHDLARGAVEQARHHFLRIASIAPWLNIVGRITLARACLLLDDPTQAREMLDELSRIRADGPRIDADARIEQLRAELDASSSLRADGAPPLTDAELRVLQYLPTNLSLAEIARRLFVSRNTVKSHVAAIYRKLGTTSRSEAVDLAIHARILHSDRLPE